MSSRGLMHWQPGRGDVGGCMCACSSAPHGYLPTYQLDFQGGLLVGRDTDEPLVGAQHVTRPRDGELPGGQIMGMLVLIILMVRSAPAFLMQRGVGLMNLNVNLSIVAIEKRVRCVESDPENGKLRVWGLTF